MRIFAIVATTLIAWLLNFITRPLLSGKLTKYGLFFLNTILGCIIALNIVWLFGISNQQADDLAPILAVALITIVAVTRLLPGGEEKLKNWYREPSDEDDKEHFSKRDMQGKPWWKFIYISGWITLIVFNIFWLIGLMIYVCGGDIQFLLTGFLFGAIISFVVIWNAIKRKRDYDNDYK